MEVRASEMMIKVNVSQEVFTRRVTPQDCHETKGQINIKTGIIVCWETLLRAGESFGLSGLLSVLRVLPVGKIQHLSLFRHCFTVICFCMLLHTKQSLRSS